MSDARYLIEWMRAGSDEWLCCGPVPEHTGFVIIGSKHHRTPVMIKCERGEEPETGPVKQHVRGHMMGPGKGPLGEYDDSFWERWYLPPGVHPMDVQGLVDKENEFYEDLHKDGMRESKKAKKKAKKRAKKKGKTKK